MTGVKIKNLEHKKDQRGSFVEIIRREDLEGSSMEFGQVALTTANKGETKGKHFHKRKTEWFCIIDGIAKFRFVDKETGKEEGLTVDGKNLKLVKVLPNIWHSIENVGNENLSVIIYIDEPFYPEDSDTYSEDL